MTPLLTVEELEARLPADSLPLDKEGELDAPRITLALREATGVIVTHLPWLLDETGELIDPIPPQFAETLPGICIDIARGRLEDTVTSSEDARKQFENNLKLLEKIDREYQGGLSGPDLQEAGIVIPSESEGIDDSRFFKKGELY
jgi:phage gp36-like protein